MGRLASMIAVLTACLGGLAYVSSGIQGADAPDLVPSGKPEMLVVGSQACARCHDRSTPLQDNILPPVCECMEMKIWREQDKHAKAFDALVCAPGNLASQMQSRLGYSVATDARCLACHAVAKSPGREQDATYHTNEGITCVACHGIQANWIDAHGSSIARHAERWRALTAAGKESRFGLVDLRNPAKRAERCASCHVGAAGKFITHDMYAAGHPLLPSFEVASFCRQMPRHWQLLREKSPAVRNVLHLSSAAARSEQADLVLHGAAATMLQIARLIAAEADRAQSSTDNPSMDLAIFDCYACHHDLKTPATGAPSWRQRRGFQGAPGRPPVRCWPMVLGLAAAGQLANSAHATGTIDEAKKSLQELQGAFTVRPFGDVASIDKAVKRLVKSLTEINNLPAGPMTEDQVSAFLLEICRAGLAENVPDFDSAREIAWSIETLHDEWPRLFDRTGANSAIEELIGLMKLKLPAGQQQEIQAALPESLQLSSAYNPADFQKLLRRVQQSSEAPKRK